jgi:hypothetical protein
MEEGYFKSSKIYSALAKILIWQGSNNLEKLKENILPVYRLLA